MGLSVNATHQYSLIPKVLICMSVPRYIPKTKVIKQQQQQQQQNTQEYTADSSIMHETEENGVLVGDTVRGCVLPRFCMSRQLVSVWRY